MLKEGERKWPQLPSAFDSGVRESESGIPAEEQVSAGVGIKVNGQQIPCIFIAYDQTNSIKDHHGTQIILNPIKKQIIDELKVLNINSVMVVTDKGIVKANLLKDLGL